MALNGLLTRTNIAPRGPSVKLSVIHRSESHLVEVPYHVRSPGNFDSRATFYENNCRQMRQRSPPSPGRLSAYNVADGYVVKLSGLTGDNVQEQVASVALFFERVVGLQTKVLSDTTSLNICTAISLIKMFTTCPISHSHMRVSPLLSALINKDAPLAQLNISRYRRADNSPIRHRTELLGNYYIQVHSRGFDTYSLPARQAPQPQASREVRRHLQQPLLPRVRPPGECLGQLLLPHLPGRGLAKLRPHPRFRP